MSLKQLSLLLIILLIQGSSSVAILPEGSDCSKIEAPRYFIPDFWLSTESIEDEDILLKEKKVIRIVNKTRIFTISCWAPFPVTMKSTSIIKNTKHVDQVKNNLQKLFFKSIEIFMADSFFRVEPNEEFHLETTCSPTCDTGRFLYGAQLYTKEEGRNLAKIAVKKVSFNFSAENSENTHGNTTHPEKYNIFVVFGLWFTFLTAVIILLRFMWKYTINLDLCNWKGAP